MSTSIHPGWTLPDGFSPLVPRVPYPPGIVFNAIAGRPWLTMGLRKAMGDPECVQVAGNTETRQLLITACDPDVVGCHRVNPSSGQISRSVETWAKKLGATPGFHAAVQVDGDEATWMIQF